MATGAAALQGPALGAAVAALGLSNKAVYADQAQDINGGVASGMEGGAYTDGPDLAPNAMPAAVSGEPDARPLVTGPSQDSTLLANKKALHIDSAAHYLPCSQMLSARQGCQQLQSATLRHLVNVPGSMSMQKPSLKTKTTDTA